MKPNFWFWRFRNGLMSDAEVQASPFVVHWRSLCRATRTPL
jgi:hypothetical protein